MIAAGGVEAGAAVEGVSLVVSGEEQIVAGHSVE